MSSGSVPSVGHVTLCPVFGTASSAPTGSKLKLRALRVSARRRPIGTGALGTRGRLCTETMYLKRLFSLSVCHCLFGDSLCVNV